MGLSDERKAFSLGADGLGIIASSLCLVHCVLTPVLLSLLSVWAHYLPSEERFHRILASLVAALGGVAIFSGYRRHRQSRVLLLMGVGLLLIFAGAYWGSRLPSHLAEVAVTMIGSCFMIAGHFLNHTFCKSCARCSKAVHASEQTPPTR
jgi:uncharacterized membrane protein YfcA